LAARKNEIARQNEQMAELTVENRELEARARRATHARNSTIAKVRTMEGKAKLLTANQGRLVKGTEKRKNP